MASTRKHADLDAENNAGLRAHLAKRLFELRREIDDAVRESRDPTTNDMAGEVQDSGDMSVSIEQTDLRNAQLKRDLSETSAVIDALARIDSGHFGTCERCADEIEPGRLAVQPMARHCFRCQENLERTSGRDVSARMRGETSELG